MRAYVKKSHQLAAYQLTKKSALHSREAINTALEVMTSIAQISHGDVDMAWLGLKWALSYLAALAVHSRANGYKGFVSVGYDDDTITITLERGSDNGA